MQEMGNCREKKKKIGRRKARARRRKAEAEPRKAKREVAFSATFILQK